MFWKITGLAFLLMLLLVLMHLFSFKSISACGVCGIYQHKIEYQLPHTRFTYKEFRYEDDSKLSSYLKKQGWMTAHTHQWQFIHGSGNGIMCALGGNRNIIRQINDTRIIEIIDAHRKYAGEAVAKDWIKLMMDIKKADHLHNILLYQVEYPDTGFSNHQEFIDWKNSFMQAMSELGKDE